jgi:predicted negative regulator of RcsB-dependent stress response
VELYDSEEQQVEAIKDWWKENGKAVILGAVVGFGGLFGWRYYQDSVVSQQETLSEGYTKALASDSDIAAFIEANSGKEYATLAAMQLSKSHVDAGEFEDALKQLQIAKSNTKDEALLPLITFRIARLEAQLDNLDEAISQLDTITAEGWAGRVAETKGDYLLRKGDTEAAYAAYTQAQQASDASQLLQMKLDDLAK